MNNSFCEETDLMFPNKQLKNTDVVFTQSKGQGSGS